MASGKGMLMRALGLMHYVLLGPTKAMKEMRSREIQNLQTERDAAIRTLKYELLVLDDAPYADRRADGPPDHGERP